MQEQEKELQEYAKALDILARDESEAIFKNSDHKHAAIALSFLMDFTKKEFILYDDNLVNDIVKYDEVKSFKKSFADMLKRGVNTKLVISDKDDDDNVDLVNFFKEKVEKYPKLFSMKLANSNFKSKLRSIYGEKINFAIGDDNKFRLELYGDNSVKQKERMAFVSFNNSQGIHKVSKVFKQEYHLLQDEDYFGVNKRNGL